MVHEDGKKKKKNLHIRHAWAFKTGNQSPRVQIWGLVVDCSISLCMYNDTFRQGQTLIAYLIFPPPPKKKLSNVWLVNVGVIS